MMLSDYIRAQFEPGDLVELRLLPSKRQQYTTAETLIDLLPDLRAANGAGENVYIGANPRKRRGGKAKDVAVARSVFADLEQIDPAAALAKVKAAGLPVPTMTVCSGHGAHVYWRLSEPMEDLAPWSVYQKGLAARLQSDPVVFDPSRVMRLPGFTNHKPPAAECVLIDADPQRRYRLEDLTMQQREQREQSGPSEQRRTERTEAIASVDSVLSVDSVSPLSPFSLLQAEQQIREAIDRTLPGKAGLRHRQVFHLARAIKAIPGAAEQAAAVFRPVVRRWHDAGVKAGVIETAAFTETWTDFCNGWPNVRYAMGESPLDTIMQTLELRQPPPEAAQYDLPAVRRLVALLAELQRQAGDAPFFLDCRTGARLLEADHVQVWRWLKMLVADGVLAQVEQGRTGYATRWRWLGNA